MRLLVIILAMAVWLYLARPARAVGSLQPAEATRLAYRDILTLAPQDQLYARYIWVRDTDAKLKWSAWAAVAGHTNFLSTRRRIVSPVVVLDDGSLRQWPNIEEKEFARIVLIRLDIRDYGWSFEQWENLGDPTLEPLFHVFTYVPYPAGFYTNGTPYLAGREKVTALAPWLLEPLGLPADQPARDIYLHAYKQSTIQLSVLTGYSQTPIVEATNFIWQTAIQFDRPAGYYTWLRITDKKTFDRLVRLDDTITPFLDAVSKSGVAVQPRRIERYGRGDGYWATKDQVGPGSRAVGKRNPLSENNLDRNALVFDAQEIFGRLDNGLWATVLVNNKGELQDSAPDGVGYFHQSITNDGKIHPPLTCLGCHDRQPNRGGLHPFSPYWRNKYATPGPLGLASFVPKKLKKFEDEYLADFSFWADIDRRIYIAALYQANGLTPDKYAAVLYDVFNRWDRALNLSRAAVEYGVSEEVLVKAMQQQLVTYGQLDSINNNWIVPEVRREEIGRDQFAESFNLGQLALRGLPTWPDRLRMKYPQRGR